ncbi:MAG: hypothetical protein HAW67_05220 [Endozoicomonadaceae bacterium]|nr:hypothetical protein [Endozoicomonadaceae bacterium]
MIDLNGVTKWAAISTLSADGKRDVLTWMSTEGANSCGSGLAYKQMEFNKLKNDINEGLSTFTVSHILHKFSDKDVTSLVKNCTKVELVNIDLSPSNQPPSIDASDMEIAVYIDNQMSDVNNYEFTTVDSL